MTIPYAGVKIVETAHRAHALHRAQLHQATVQ
jgi:hypothetical protein